MNTSQQSDTALRIIADLEIEPEWIFAEEDGAGFVACVLGTWLTTQTCDDGSERLHIEVRLAQHVIESDEVRQFLEARNHNGLVGRWVLDASTGVVALVADLLIVHGTRRFASEVVAEMLNTAETLAYMSAPQRYLGGLTALTLGDAGPRPDWNKIIEHLPEFVYPEGESDRVPARHLLQVQSQLSSWLPDWSFDHADDHSLAETEDWTFLVRAVEHPHAGWGLQVVLHDRHGCEAVEAIHFAQAVNRADSFVARHLSAPGAWTYFYDALEYRTFLPAWLLRAADDPESLQFVSTILRGVAARADSPLLERTDAVTGPVLVHPTWDRDEEAIVLERRHPINDGEEAVDSFVWLDYFERAAYTTEESFRLWRSRLQPDDLTDKGVVGYSEWFERELASRRQNRPLQGPTSRGDVND